MEWKGREEVFQCRHGLECIRLVVGREEIYEKVGSRQVSHVLPGVQGTLGGRHDLIAFFFPLHRQAW